jgi:hypothetical protein
VYDYYWVDTSAGELLLPKSIIHTKEKYTTDLEILKTYLIAASPFGVLGGHQYYSGRKLWGLSYTLTLGGCGVMELSSPLYLARRIARCIIFRSKSDSDSMTASENTRSSSGECAKL